MENIKDVYAVIGPSSGTFSPVVVSIGVNICGILGFYVFSVITDDNRASQINPMTTHHLTEVLTIYTVDFSPAILVVVTFVGHTLYFLRVYIDFVIQMHKVQK